MSILKDIVETRLRNLTALMEVNEELKIDVFQIELEYATGLLKSILDEYSTINTKTNDLINKLKKDEN